MKFRFVFRSTRPDDPRRHAPRILPVLRSLGLVCALCLSSAAFAQNRYQITRIPAAEGANSVALGINSKGDVVGYSFQGEDYRAYLYSSSDQSMADVGSFGGKINAACAVNDAGQVTGYSQDQNGNLLAFVFSRNQPIASLGMLEGASASEAFGINNKGEMVGDSQSGPQNHRPVLFSSGSVQDLGLGGSNEPDALETAYAINDSDQIVGRRSAGGNAFHAFLYVNGSTTDLATLGGTNGEALAVNKNGSVVGDSDTADGPAHAFVFDQSQLKDLGTLPGFEKASYARGINGAGDIVGESDGADQKRAFLYTQGQLVELDQLAENLSQAGFSSLDVAYAINDSGWIVGYGTTTDNVTAAFIAAPEKGGPREQTGGVPQPQGQAQASESSNADYDVFYTKLSSDEGNWVEAGNYGYCFRPRVSEDWRPYRDGHWVWTDRGWYWDSNERFGWATYHYGRWVNFGGTGWCWVPGNQWAPAWVSWRESDQNVGWAPLPPEAEFSEQRSISSWSDSYYDVGPAAYVFISYSHWHEPSYARYVEPPERNVQIINETKNVTNIVTNNNVINNFGPPVQTVAARTNQNIQQVKLVVNPATEPQANYGQALRGNQLNVVAPPAVLKTQATRAPAVQTQIATPQVEKGWHGVNPQEAEKLRKTIAEQNPPPKNLAKPTPFVNPQIGKTRQGTEARGPTPAATSSPAAVVGQKTPSNLLKPGERPSKESAGPGVSPNNAVSGGKKPVPANLIGPKPGPGGSPTVPANAGSPSEKRSPSATPSEVSPSVPKAAPPNLNAPRPAATPVHPETRENQPGAGPATRPGGKSPPEPNTPHPSPTPHVAATPAEEKRPGPETTPSPLQRGESTTSRPTLTPHPQLNQEGATPAPHHEPAKPATPTPAGEEEKTPREISTPKPVPAATPRHEGKSAPKATPEVKAPTPPPRPAKEEEKTPREIPTPKPPPAATPRRESESAPKATPEVKPPAPAPKPVPEAKPPAPAPKPVPEAKAPAPEPRPVPEVKAPPKQENKTPAAEEKAHQPEKARESEKGKPTPAPR